MMVSPFLKFTNVLSGKAAQPRTGGCPGYGRPPGFRRASLAFRHAHDALPTDALPTGFEPAHCGLEGRCSVQTELREPERQPTSELSFDPGPIGPHQQDSSGAAHHVASDSWSRRRSRSSELITAN